MTLLSEAGSYRLRVGTVTSSIVFIPYLAAAMLVGPAWAIAIAGVTNFLAETVLRRKRALKVIHNTSKEILAVGSAAYLYLALGGHVSLVAFNPVVPAFLGAVVVFFSLNQGTTAIAIALSTRTRIREAWGRVGDNHLYDIASSSMALLLTFLYVQLPLWGPILVVIPLLLIRHNYWMTLRFEQEQRDSLVLMVKSIEARDPYTSGHSVRVSRFARTVAEEMGLSAKEIDQIATAALLHDVGKIYQ
ncbi:MAG: HD domain-containing protein, partial [Gemmatimonadetes bacterium]|nr:HD domain-containing protein [Gemmatimonadota bacterium]